MSMPSLGQMVATAVLVGLVLWGKFSWDTYQAMKTATLRTELEKKVREELKAEAAAETSALEERKQFETEMKKKAREELEAEAAAATESEKKVREKLEAEAAAVTESEKKVREKLKAEAGAEITALEKQKLFESGMAYTTRDVYEKGMSNGEVKGRNRALAAQRWALGTGYGEGPILTHNVGPEPIHIVELEPIHNPGPERGHNAGLERDRSAGPGCGRNARPRRGHGSRHTSGARRAPSPESSSDGEEEYHGSHR